MKIYRMICPRLPWANFGAVFLRFLSKVFQRIGLLLAISASICGTHVYHANADDSHLTHVVAQFDWILNAQFAGFYQAIEQGFFKAEGLEVELRSGATTPDTVKMTLEAGPIAFGCAESNVLLADAAEGAPIRLLGTMFQNSPMGWMYLKGGSIKSFTDLADKRVGTHADGERVIRLLLQEAGADISKLETYDCGYDPNIIIEGEADAMQCYFIDEYVRLEQLIGKKAGIFLAKDHGYDAYSQVIFTSINVVENHPEIASAFLRALKKGWGHAFSHPEATVDLILSKYNPELDREYQLGSLAKIEQLMIPGPGSLFRPMDREILLAGQKSLYSFGLISRLVDIDELLMQQFLPAVLPSDLTSPD
jgi:NitT/TauT family transport system substrate-binding protein